MTRLSLPATVALTFFLAGCEDREKRDLNTAEGRGEVVASGAAPLARDDQRPGVQRGAGERSGPFEPGQVYQGEGPPFARLVLRPEGGLWRISLFGGGDPRQGQRQPASCHVEAHGLRTGAKVSAPLIAGDKWVAEELAGRPRSVEIEPTPSALLVSTNVDWCGLGVSFEGPYRKLPAIDPAVGRERVQGLTGEWRVVFQASLHPPPADGPQDLMGARLEITPEHIAWIRHGEGGTSEWDYYCADPRLQPARGGVSREVRTVLENLRGSQGALVDRVWSVECSEDSVFPEREAAVVLLKDGRLGMTADSNTFVLLASAR